jgi:peptidoglycan/xylan/chitin deacetylase (PgdA/CDA1 family)
MPTMTVFFRFDDYSETSPAIVESGLVNALRSVGACATFAVIPAVTEGGYHVPGDRAVLPIGAAKARFLQAAIADGTVEVALHGWNHRTQSGSAPHGEFVRIDEREQFARLQQGKSRFREAGLAATVFVPPWNAYDSNTLLALSQAGLRCLSANRYGPALPGPMQYLPITAAFDELRAAIATARESGDPDAIVGVLLHPYDFEESGDKRAITNCQAFEQELRWLVAQPDVKVLTVGQIAQRNATLDVARYRANQPLAFESIFPPFVRTTTQTPFLRSMKQGRRSRALRSLATFTTYGTAALASAVAAGFLWSRPEVEASSLAGVARLGLTLLLFMLVARTIMHRAVYFRSMLALSVLAGIFVGVWR